MVESEKSLEQTPTWAVAVVCTVFVVASLLVERGIHTLGKHFKRRKQKELFHTLETIKNELMLLGFISLLLTVFQPRIAKLCMPERLNHIMLPCKYVAPAEAAAPAAAPLARRRLLATVAATTESSAHCSAGKVQVISVEGLHQLHIFIFVMAVVHVCYSALTVLLALTQVHSWKKWEQEAHNESTKSVDQALQTRHTNAGGKFTTGRIKYRFLHTSRTGLNLDSYVYSFIRQFGKPIYKADYLCLRLGFIANHQLNADYDFHSYIQRSMEEDFKLVVGISAYLWAFVCIFLLLDINGWFTYFWIAFIPTILILIVGTKLQQIITDLALEVRGGVEKIDYDLENLDDDFKKAEKPKQEIVCKPIRPRDDLFWFNRPRFLLYLVHFILFQNAFELAFFFWAMFTYGFTSCLVGRRWMIIVRLVMGVFVQILCSASTLPLYALVSQLGSNIKLTVFKSEATASAIHGWREKAKKKSREKGHGHHPVGHHLAGIVGLNKEVDEHGHPRAVELPNVRNKKAHHGNGDENMNDGDHGAVHNKKTGHGHQNPPGHQHQHLRPHLHAQPEDSHSLEILDQRPPLRIRKDLPDPDEDEAPGTDALPEGFNHDPETGIPKNETKSMSLANVNKILMAKKNGGEP